MEMSRDCKNL